MAKLSPVPEPKAQDPAPDLMAAVRASIAGMTWLTPADDGLVALALNYAEQIEAAATRLAELEELWALARGEKDLAKRLQKLEAAADVTKMLGWLGPQLQGVLRDLGGAAMSRKAMAPTSPVGGALSALRNSVGRAESGTGVHDAPEVDPAGS